MKKIMQLVMLVVMALAITGCVVPARGYYAAPVVAAPAMVDGYGRPVPRYMAPMMAAPQYGYAPMVPSGPNIQFSFGNRNRGGGGHGHHHHDRGGQRWGGGGYRR